MWYALVVYLDMLMDYISYLTFALSADQTRCSPVWRAQSPCSLGPAALQVGAAQTHSPHTPMSALTPWSQNRKSQMRGRHLIPEPTQVKSDRGTALGHAGERVSSHHLQSFRNNNVLMCSSFRAQSTTWCVLGVPTHPLGAPSAHETSARGQIKAFPLCSQRGASWRRWRATRDWQLAGGADRESWRRSGAAAPSAVFGESGSTRLSAECGPAQQQTRVPARGPHWAGTAGELRTPGLEF